MTLLVYSSGIFAQEYTISGTILDENNSPVSFANVLLLKSSAEKIDNENSAGFKSYTGVISDEQGRFDFKEVEKWNYLLQVSFIGYQSYTQQIQLNDNIVLNIVLKEAVEALNEIEVIARKPTLKREADRLIFNVANTSLSEGNMMEVLRSTPGVLVLDNSISVKNGEPTIYINDRKINLTANELVQLLESAPASSIKSVEVITNPSAKYDAESGSVINIVMSKNLITGYRGRAFTNYTQGVYPRYNVGMTNFFKNNKISLYANYSYSENKERRKSHEEINFLDSNNNVDEIWASDFRRTTQVKNHNINFNFDYFLNERNTLSVSSNMLFQPYFRHLTRSKTDITDDLLNPEFNFNSENLSSDDKYNLGLDLDFVHNFNESSKLSINGHATLYDYNRQQDVESNYFNTNPDFSTAFNTNPKQNTEIYSTQLDYEKEFNDSSTFSAGIKVSQVNTESSITRFDIENGQEVLNSEFTDAFDYDEDIYATYLNYEKSWEKLSLAVGLRAEQTDLEGISLINSEISNQNYLEFFPKFSLSYQLSEKFSLFTNYNRSIERPNFQSLNPFQFFLNDNTIITGNPNLQPTFIDQASIGVSINNDMFLIEAYYKQKDANIIELPLQDNINNVLVFTPTNLGTSIDYGFDFSVNLTPTTNWQVYAVTSFYNTEEKAVFDGNTLKKDTWSNYSVLTNDWSFLKDKSLAVNFSMVYVGKYQQGFQIIDPMLFTDLSISKSLFEKKATISLHASDLLNDQDQSVVSNYLNQRNSRFMNLDNRYIKLGFSYRFGNTTLETNERSKENEERDRIKERD